MHCFGGVWCCDECVLSTVKTNVEMAATPVQRPHLPSVSSHHCSTNFAAPDYRLYSCFRSETRQSLEVETNAWTCCVASQGHYVFHDFRYQFIFRDVKDTSREESSVAVISLLEWTDMDGHGRTWTDMDGHGRTMTWLDMIRMIGQIFLQSPSEWFRNVHQSWVNRQHLPSTSLELSPAHTGRLIDS